ncbi:GntR family transcriptional regulator [Mesobacterium hydrothermale]
MERPPTMVGKAGLPAHELVYRRLREMILFGELAPGQPVTIQGLTEELQAGMTPVREALRRLTAEGALDFQGNRRICVPVLEGNDLEQLLVARNALEPELARRATARATATDIAALASIDAALDTAIRDDDVFGYLSQNYRFHAGLYALANAPILSGMVDALWLRFGPSLRGVLKTLGPSDTPDLHKALLTALAQRDAEAASRAIAQDVAQGMTRLRDGLIQA